jgi:hypothetical protein
MSAIGIVMATITDDRTHRSRLAQGCVCAPACARACVRVRVSARLSAQWDFPFLFRHSLRRRWASRCGWLPPGCDAGICRSANTLGCAGSRRCPPAPPPRRLISPSALTEAAGFAQVGFARKPFGAGVVAAPFHPIDPAQPTRARRIFALRALPQLCQCRGVGTGRRWERG